MSPTYRTGTATIEELRAPGVDPPAAPLTLTEGRFVGGSGVGGDGASAVFAGPGGWQVSLAGFGVPGVAGTLTIMPPPGTDGVNPTISGTAGVECQADIREAGPDGFAGTLTCDGMPSQLPGAWRGVDARVSFEARP